MSRSTYENEIPPPPTITQSSKFQIFLEWRSDPLAPNPAPGPLH
jgi:hypothetical protein